MAILLILIQGLLSTLHAEKTIRCKKVKPKNTAFELQITKINTETQTR